MLHSRAATRLPWNWSAASSVSSLGIVQRGSSHSVHQVGVRIAQPGELAGAVGLRGGVRTQGLQQSIAGLTAGAFVGDDEALVDEAADEIEHFVSVDVTGRGDDHLGRLEGERSGEDTETPERDSLAVVEPLVAPVDRRGEGLLARHHRAGAAGQVPEAVVQLGGDSFRRGLPAAGGGQLDRQRDAVEPVTDLGDRGGVVGRPP